MSEEFDPTAAIPAWAGGRFVSTEHHDTYPAIDVLKSDMKGKVVAITGASKGIGKGTAIAFAQAGASGILLLARSDTSSVESEVLAAARPDSNLKVISVSLSIADFAAADAALQKAKDTFGRIDVLVNNAGIAEPLEPFVQSDPSAWWQTWEVNVRGVYNITRAFLPLMLECGGDKTIINVTSIGAHMVNAAQAYSLSKLAVLRFTELIAAEHAQQGVVAFAIHPGAIKTEITKVVPEEMKFIFVDKVELAAHTAVWMALERPSWLSGRYISAVWDVDDLTAKKQQIVEGDLLKMRMVV